MTKRYAAPALLIILLIAFALRVFQLDAQSLWWDEGISLNLATSSIVEIWVNRAQRLHPPGYFILLKGWLSLVGVSPFTGRYLSVLASWVQVTAVYTTTRYWFAKHPHGKWIVWISTLLITLSPLSIIYGQEARVYALLPLIYLAMLFAALKIVSSSKNASTGSLAKWWIVLGVFEWFGAHLHYITFLIVAIVNVWLLWHIFRQKRGLWKPWLITHIAVVLASLPWFVSVFLNFIAVRNRVNTGRFLSEPVPFDFLVQQVWGFHFTGLAGSIGREDVRFLAIVAAIAFLALILWHLIRTSSWLHFGRLLLFWAFPLALAFLIWSVRSFAHPRYISIYAVGVLPLIAYLVAENKRFDGIRRAVYGLFAFGLLGAILGLAFLSLDDYFFDPTVAKDDIRGVAAYLESRTNAGDLILVPDEDWSLAFEYDGDATIEMPGTKQRETMWAHLEDITAVSRQVFVLEYERGAHDWQHVVPFVLERAGYLEDVVSIDDLIIKQFQIHEPVVPVSLTPVVAQFESLALTDVWVEDGAEADTAVTVALSWRLDAPVTESLNVSLQLQDIDGWALASRDQEIVNENGRPTPNWQVGTTTTTYHVIPLPEGVPPLDYRVSLSVFAQTEAGGAQTLDLLNEAGQRMVIGEASLVREIGIESNPNGAFDLQNAPNNALLASGPKAMSNGLLLQAATVDRKEVAPGQSVFVQLQWQAESELPSLPLTLDLVQDGVSLAPQVSVPVLERYPTSMWLPSEVVLEHRRLVVPPGVEGDADVVVLVGETSVTIGQLSIEATDNLFVAPDIANTLNEQFGDVARLIGFELLTKTANSSQPFDITLYWQAITTGSNTNYTVFVHLLDEAGNVIAQHDAQPVNGQRPTGGWIAEEYIVDLHQLEFNSTSYTGEAQLAVGLYDAATGERLKTLTANDVVLLPLTIDVE